MDTRSQNPLLASFMRRLTRDLTPSGMGREQRIMETISRHDIPDEIPPSNDPAILGGAFCVKDDYRKSLLTR